MVRFPEADARLFRGVFVCRRCKTKKRASIMKVLNKQIACRKCGSYVLRIKRKKK